MLFTRFELGARRVKGIQLYGHIVCQGIDQWWNARWFIIYTAYGSVLDELTKFFEPLDTRPVIGAGGHEKGATEFVLGFKVLKGIMINQEGRVLDGFKLGMKLFL